MCLAGSWPRRGACFCWLLRYNSGMRTRVQILAFALLLAGLLLLALAVHLDQLLPAECQMACCRKQAKQLSASTNGHGPTFPPNPGCDCGDKGCGVSACPSWPCDCWVLDEAAK